MIYALLFPSATFLVTWVMFLAVMCLRANRSELAPLPKFVAYWIILPIAGAFDVFLNLTVGTLVFVELSPILTKRIGAGQRVKLFRWVWIPKTDYTFHYPELLFTARCSRHLDSGSGWRYKIAVWFCRNWLDPFDLNNRHCS